MARIKSISYSKTFPLLSTGAFEKIFVEIELEENDNPRDTLYHAKRIVTDFHFESNKAAEKQIGTHERFVTPDPYGSGQFYDVNAVTKPTNIDAEQSVSPLTKIAALIEQINTCTELTVLESYRLMVRGNVSLQNAYDNKYLELTNKQN